MWWAIGGVAAVLALAWWWNFGSTDDDEPVTKKPAVLPDLRQSRPSGNVSDLSYLMALLGLCVGVPVEVLAAYPMFEDYDPFGLKFVIPVLGAAGLFGGLFLPAVFRPLPLNGFKIGVMLALALFSIFAAMHDADENGLRLLTLCYHLTFPVCVWGWQVWLWKFAGPKHDV